MASARKHDVVVIGGGPGGYVAAIRAAQLGMSVACVERESALGGTCLRIGCIPSKALLESSEVFVAARERSGAHGVRVGDVTLDLGSMLKRKDQTVQALTKGVDALFGKHRIVRYTGQGRITGRAEVVVETDAERLELRARHILIATGSVPTRRPGLEPAGDRIGTSTEALSYPDVPGHLVVVGAGYIGVEIGTVWRRLGAKVTIIEAMDRILPAMDAEIAGEAARVLGRQGLDFRLGSRVVRARAEGDGCVVEREDADAIRCDRVLLAIGRSPMTVGLGLESVGIAVDEHGRIPVNERFMTKVDGIYAIGDVIGEPLLAHKAQEEGIACVEMLAGRFGRVDYDAIPSVVYTSPEIAAVGKTEDQVGRSGIEYRKGIFHFRANARARILGQVDGRVKMLADRRTDRVLGVHVFGARAGDLIAEAAAAMAFGASSEDIARTCHAHPTLAEAVREAALAVEGRALHA